MKHHTSQKLDLTYQMASPRSAKDFASANAIGDLKDFWLSHWTSAFASTGAPESGWEKHFNEQDVVVGLLNGGEIIACHLYTLYDIQNPKTLDHDYFSYLKPSSIETLLERKMTRLMSMEYLGVSPAYSQNTEHLSLGKLMVALATFVGESLSADAVFGTPITTTSTPKMMANVGAITLEEKIEKYGYELCLQYVPTSPRSDCKDEIIRARAQGLWNSRRELTSVPSFPQKTRAA